MTSCSKAPRGLFVLLRVGGVLTAIAVSPSPWSRHCPDRDAFRAGRNLPDKEFRYLRTVIVTAAVHRGFGSRLAPLPLTFRHWAGISPYTSPYGLSRDLWFCYPVAWASLLRLQNAPVVRRSPSRAPLLPKVRGQIAEFLNQGSLVHLSLLSQPTCVGLRYGHHTPSRAGISRRYRVSSLESVLLRPLALASRSSHRGLTRHSLPAWTALVLPRNLSCRFLHWSNGRIVVQDYQPVVHRFGSRLTLRPD